MSVLLPLALAAAAVQVAPAEAMTLDEALSAAFAHAPALAEAEAGIEAAGGRLTQARAATRPSAAVSGSLGVGWLDPRGYFGLEGENVLPRAVQGSVEQPLFTGGRAGAAIAQARAGERVAAATVDAVRGQLAVAVVESYGAVLVAQERRRLYLSLIGELTELERQSRLRFGAGESPHTDISQAQARLAEARASLAEAEGMIVSARARLRALTGREGGLLSPLPAPPATPQTLDEAVAAAADASPAIAQAQAALDAARAATRLARAERMPTVGAFAEGSYVRDQFFPNYRADSATIGVRARWQIFDSGRTRGRIAEASGEERAAEARLRQARSEVEERVIAVHQAIRTAAFVEAARAEQLAAAEESVRNVRHEVRVGMKPQLDLLDAEREALAAATEAFRARADRLTVAYRLIALLGRE